MKRSGSSVAKQASTRNVLINVAILGVFLAPWVLLSSSYGSAYDPLKLPIIWFFIGLFLYFRFLKLLYKDDFDSQARQLFAYPLRALNLATKISAWMLVFYLVIFIVALCLIALTIINGGK
jgi:hypothetical protein